MKENLKPYVYKLWERAYERNRVLFVERSGELPVLARLSDQVVEPQGNQA